MIKPYILHIVNQRKKLDLFTELSNAQIEAVFSDQTLPKEIQMQVIRDFQTFLSDLLASSVGLNEEEKKKMQNELETKITQSTALSFKARQKYDREFEQVMTYMSEENREDYLEARANEIIDQISKAKTPVVNSAVGQELCDIHAQLSVSTPLILQQLVDIDQFGKRRSARMFAFFFNLVLVSREAYLNQKGDPTSMQIDSFQVNETTLKSLPQLPLKALVKDLVWNIGVPSELMMSIVLDELVLLQKHSQQSIINECELGQDPILHVAQTSSFEQDLRNAL